MDNFQPGAVKALVEYLYTGGYGSLSTSDNAVGVSQTPSDLESSSSSPDTATLLLDHMRVNAIGDYYQVDGLMTAANQKIKHLHESSKADKSWVASLPTAIWLAISCTANEGLLDILAEVTAKELASIIHLEDFISIEPIYEFAGKVLHGCWERIQGLLNENDQLKSDLSSKDFERRMAEREHERVQSHYRRMEQCLTVLNNTSFCRIPKCGGEFWCAIDAKECIVRCDCVRRRKTQAAASFYRPSGPA
ncbi:uncharacterized protein BO72DRAFT_490867 [Aspergillus fijiensis CBS 313.89]|uniref:BTB domain-containing protein n=1 Tax=Aspergillus fijiensis CBS 313.89 TaxID=1448319 RepID=A0A8G1VS84_9EURO|nr:uncharacterized protein BO72DRAFT_490867 [Aspergillus fijiensis CBS 313.89]RAK70980.1 hypothetical protein BO72DRAFT_490867 [Aspergillus fijiensis CBS 313.89]